MTSKPTPKVLNKYVVKCIDYVYDPGNAKKKPGVVCRLQILEGSRKGDTVMWYGSMSEQSQEFTADALRALGMTNDDILNPQGLGSRKALAVERENLWPGAKNKTKIDFVNPIVPPKLKASNPVSNPSSTTSKFKALFKSKPALEMHPAVVAPELNAGEVARNTTETDPEQGAEYADTPF